MRRRTFTAALTVWWLLAAGANAEAPATQIRMLFLGNSITYVGNLPAVFAALCESSGTMCSVEMIVTGGVTLHDRLVDHSLGRTQVVGRFDYVVLQERGGDLLGMPAQYARAIADRAASGLARTARKLGMQPILLGTYQPGPSSEQLVAAEAALAARLRMKHASVSNDLECGRNEGKTLRWFNSDGMHPGADLTLLMAIALHREIFGFYPPATSLLVKAPLYGTSSGLLSDEFASAQPVRPGTPMSINYDATTIQSIIEIASGRCGK